MPRPIRLDVDTGTDDALAILYAVRHPDLKVLGISCVAGNSGVDQVVTNTLKILDAAGARSDIPVARGAAQPLVERARPEGAFHGEDGLGGVVLPEPARAPSELTAVEMLRQEITNSSTPVTLAGLASRSSRSTERRPTGSAPQRIPAPERREICSTGGAPARTVPAATTSG